MVGEVAVGPTQIQHYKAVSSFLKMEGNLHFTQMPLLQSSTIVIVTECCHADPRLFMICLGPSPQTMHVFCIFSRILFRKSISDHLTPGHTGIMVLAQRLTCSMSSIGAFTIMANVKRKCITCLSFQEGRTLSSSTPFVGLGGVCDGLDSMIGTAKYRYTLMHGRGQGRSLADLFWRPCIMLLPTSYLYLQNSMFVHYVCSQSNNNH